MKTFGHTTIWISTDSITQAESPLPTKKPMESMLAPLNWLYLHWCHMTIIHGITWPEFKINKAELAKQVPWFLHWNCLLTEQYYLTRLNPSFSISALSEGVCLAKMPPWTAGWRVLTLPPSISGNPVRSDTSLYDKIKKWHIHTQH